MIRTILRFDVVSGRSYVCSVGSAELLSLMVILFCKVRHFVRVVSNSDDIDSGAGEIHTRAGNFKETRDEGSAGPTSHDSSPRERRFSCARVYFTGIANISDYSQSRLAPSRSFLCPKRVI